MGAELLLGLDLGGGSVRCLLLDAASGATHSASAPCRFEPDPAVAMSSRVDPQRAWQAVATATRTALARAGARPEDVIGIAASSMRHGSALLDADGRELLLATNRDARALAESQELAQREGAAVLARSGRWPNPVQAGTRLLWVARHAPELLARAAHHLSLSEWLAYRLTGVAACDASHAAETLVCELSTRAWAKDRIQAWGLPDALFPPLRLAGEALGPLRAEAAAELGLRAGTPVAVGGADTQCALLGAGVTEPGELGIVAGTSTPLQYVQDRPPVEEEGRLWSSHHVVAERWVVESNAAGVGEGVSWFARLLHPDAEHPELALLYEAEQAPPGAGGLISTFGVEVMDGRVLRMPLGNLSLNFLGGGSAGLQRRNASRALLEGIGFGLRANLEQLESVAGAPPTRVRIGGGLSRSAFFTGLVADCFDRPVEVPQSHETTALGAALCAGVAAGVFGDLAEGAARLVRVARRHEPDPARAALYRELYPAWREFREISRQAEGPATGFALRAAAAADAGAVGASDPGFRPRILVTAELDDPSVAALREIGDVEYQSYRRAKRMLKGDALVEALRGVHVFVTEIDVVEASVMAAASDLRLLAVCRGDAVNVDREAARALGIPVLHTPGRNADAVADLAVAFMLMLLRRFPAAGAYLRDTPHEAGEMRAVGRAYAELRGRELWRKSVGLVGLGAVGRKVVERVRPFGARCLVYDPYLPEDRARLAGAEPAGLDEVLASSDIISLHAAVTDESRGLIGAAELAKMRPGSLLVNTARAALLVEDALVEALRSGHLGGAALDVFASEPPGSDHPLLALENVIATPHMGGNTQDVPAHQGAIVAEELGRLARGERPRHALDPASLDGFDWSEARPAVSDDVLAGLGRGPAPAVTDLERDQGARKRAR